MVVQWIEAHAAPWQADIRPTPKRFSNDETRTHELNPLLNWPPPTADHLSPPSQRQHKLPTRVHVRARQLSREAKTHEIARNSLSAATHIQRTTLLAVKTIWQRSCVVPAQRQHMVFQRLNAHMYLVDARAICRVVHAPADRRGAAHVGPGQPATGTLAVSVPTPATAFDTTCNVCVPHFLVNVQKAPRLTSCRHSWRYLRRLSHRA